MNKNILMISAHADDHVSCAGTIFKLKKERRVVPFEVILTDSSQGQDFKESVKKYNGSMKEIRLKELSQASKVLGIKKTYLLDEPDFGLQPNQKVIFEVAKIIREVKPQIVFLLGATDIHPDHKAAFRIGLEALKLASFTVKLGGLNPHRVPLILCTDQELPNSIHIIVDITRYLPKKEKLFKAYGSQMSPKAIAFEKGLISVRGYHLTNGEHRVAEAFSLQSEFPIIGFDNMVSDLF